MTITIEAVYENGVLKPKDPLSLAEGTRVRIAVSTHGDADDPFEAVIGTCAGPPDGADDQDPLDEVIGICTEGPDISLAARHDEILYGLRPRAPRQP